MGQRVKPSPHLGIFADMYHFKPLPKGIPKIDVCTWLIGGCGRTAPFFILIKVPQATQLGILQTILVKAIIHGINTQNYAYLLFSIPSVRWYFNFDF